MSDGRSIYSNQLSKGQHRYDANVDWDALGVHIGATWLMRLNHPCAVAIRHCVKLLWPLRTTYTSSFFMSDEVCYGRVTVRQWRTLELICRRCWTTSTELLRAQLNQSHFIAYCLQTFFKHLPTPVHTTFLLIMFQRPRCCNFPLLK